MNNKISSAEALRDSKDVKDQIEQLIFVMKENITLHRVEIFESDAFGVYMHQRVESSNDPAVNGMTLLGPRFGLVEFSLEDKNKFDAIKSLQPFFNQLAVHVLSMEPKFIDKQSAPKDTSLEDILMEQEFSISGQDKTVYQAMTENKEKIEKSHGSNFKLNKFNVWVSGEGIEAPSEQFADEVEKLLRKKELKK